MPKLLVMKLSEKSFYALTYGNPDRCKEHRENRKPQYSLVNAVTQPYLMNQVKQKRYVVRIVKLTLW